MIVGKKLNIGACKAAGAFSALRPKKKLAQKGFLTLISYINDSKMPKNKCSVSIKLAGSL